MKKLGIALIVLAVGAIAALEWIARATEARYDEMLGEYAIPGTIALEKSRYERGWLTTDAETAVTIEGSALGSEEDPEPVRFALRHEIRHVPITDDGPALAEISTSVVLPEGANDRLREALGDRSLGEVRTALGFDGRANTIVSSEPYEGELSLEGGNRLIVRWGGLRGNVGTERGANEGAARFELPELSIETDDGSLLLRAVSSEGTFRRGPNALLLGDSVTRMEELSVQSPAATVRIAKIAITTSQDVDENGAIDVRWESTMDEARFGESEYAAGRMALLIENLDPEVYAEAATSASQPGDEASLAEWMPKLRRLLVRSPSMAVDPVELRTPSGELSGRLRIGFDAEGLGEEFHPFELLVRVQSEAEGRAPAELVEAAFAAKAAETARSETPDAIVDDEVLAEAAREKLAELEENGWIVRDGDFFASSMTFSKGQLTVNGQPGDELIQELMQQALMGGAR